MKTIARNVTQERRYGDKVGLMYVLLEEGDVKEDIIKEFHDNSNFWDKVTFKEEISEYTHGDVTYTGTILVFDVVEGYMD